MKCRLLAMILLMSGCATAGLKTTVVLEDGVSRAEAMVLASEHLRDRPESKEFYHNRPELMRDMMVNDYAEYWFVSFPPRAFDRSFWSYLIVLEKANGSVVFSEEYVPMKVLDYDWVFDPSIPRRF